jgi:hypothetical protein
MNLRDDIVVNGTKLGDLYTPGLIDPAAKVLLKTTS